MFERKTDELKLWKTLTNLWSLITILFFVLTFFRLPDLSPSLAHVSIIYVSLLSLFIGVKEVSRWQDKKFNSHYRGEFFVVLWTLLMITFTLLKALWPENYTLTNEFTATYLSIVGLFAISRKSKTLRK